MDDVAEGLLGQDGLVGGLVGGLSGGDDQAAPATDSVDKIADSAPTTLASAKGTVLSEDGVLKDVTGPVGDTIEIISGTTVTNVADGFLSGLTDTVGGLVGGISSEKVEVTVADTTDTAPADLEGTAQTEVTAEAKSSEGPDIFTAIGDTLEGSDGLLGALIPNVTFIGQPVTNDDFGPHTDDANGSLLHGLI